MERSLELAVVFCLDGFDDAEAEGDAGRVELVDACFDVAGGDPDLDNLVPFFRVELGADTSP